MPAIPTRIQRNTRNAERRRAQITSAPVYRVEVTFRDGRVERSPRTDYRCVAAAGAVQARKHPDVVAAAIVTEASLLSAGRA